MENVLISSLLLTLAHPNHFMKKRVTTLIAVLIFTGCTHSESFLDEKETCSKYQQELVEEVEKIGKTHSVSVEKLFYSPKIDSCLYVVKRYSSTTNKPGANGEIVDYSLYNFFTKEELTSVKGCDGELHCGLSTAEAKSKIESKVSEYE